MAQQEVGTVEEQPEVTVGVVRVVVETAQYQAQVKRQVRTPCWGMGVEEGISADCASRRRDAGPFDH